MSVWSCRVGPDVLFSLVNYCRIIIVRSVSTDCINEETHRRLHALARRALELEMGLPTASRNSGVGSLASCFKSWSPDPPLNFPPSLESRSQACFCFNMDIDGVGGAWALLGLKSCFYMYLRSWGAMRGMMLSRWLHFSKPQFSHL